MTRATPIAHRATSLGLELLRVLGLFLAFAAQQYLGGLLANAPAGYCLTRPFWLDEIHTLYLAKEARVDRMMYKLAHGADCSPPALHLALWSMFRTLRVPDEVLVRSFSCAVGLMGLAATYLLLRLRFSWRVSWVAVLGMWSSSSHLVQQMFEGRPYSLWVASAAVLCLLLSIPGRILWLGPCVAGAAALLCLTHYFGVLTLGLIAFFQFACNFRDVRQRRLVAAAVAGGTLGVLVSLPICLAQRAAVPADPWVSDPDIKSCVKLLDDYLLVYALVLPALAYAFQRLFRGTAESDPAESEQSFHNYAGLCGLMVFPLVVILFSYAIQPALVTRYALPATLAYAPLIALIAARLSRGFLRGLAVLFFLAGLGGAMIVHEPRPDFRGAAPLVRIARKDRPLVVHWRVIAYPMCLYTGADPSAMRISFLYRDNGLSKFDAWEYALARKMAELFDLPRTLEPEELASRNEFYLLAVTGEETRYKGWKAEPLDVILGPLRGFRMTRTRYSFSPTEDQAGSGNRLGAIARP